MVVSCIFLAYSICHAQYQIYFHLVKCLYTLWKQSRVTFYCDLCIYCVDIHQII